MSEKNNNPGQNENQPKMPRFNMNWIYGLILFSLILMFFTTSGNGMSSADGISKKVTYTKFKAYVDSGYADNVVVNKKEGNLKMYVPAKKIRDVFGKGTQMTGTNPYVEVEYGSIDELERYLEAAQAEKKISDFSFENNKDSLFMNILINLLPVLPRP